MEEREGWREERWDRGTRKRKKGKERVGREKGEAMSVECEKECEGKERYMLKEV